MSDKFELAKSYYDRGLWSKERVRNAVGKWITAEEYQIITSEAYTH